MTVLSAAQLQHGRPALLVLQRHKAGCTLPRETATFRRKLAVQPLQRTQQRLTCRAPHQHSEQATRNLPLHGDEASFLHVKPTNEVDLDVVSAASQGDTTQRPWWDLAQRFARGAAVFAMVLALALAPLSGSALAASSGGRVGGSSFGAARSGAGSYGGAGSFSGAGSYAGGYSRGGYMAPAPSVTVVPQTSFGFGFGGWGYGPGFYGGYGYPVAGGGGGGGLFTLLALGVVGFAALQLLPQLMGGGEDESGYGRCTVAKVQIGLTGTAVSMKRELERIAKRADTNTSDGLNYVLQETVLSLLRHPEYCIYGAASTKGLNGLDATEERFNEASMEERGKFKEETLMNVAGRTRNTSGSGRYGSLDRGPSGDELIVVTILVAAEGDLKIPNISNQEQLRTALNRLGSLRSDQVLAVEVLWTPQDDGDYFTRDDLAVDYPRLNTL